MRARHLILYSPPPIMHGEGDPGKSKAGVVVEPRAGGQRGQRARRSNRGRRVDADETRYGVQHEIFQMAIYRGRMHNIQAGSRKAADSDGGAGAMVVIAVVVIAVTCGFSNGPIILYVLVPEPLITTEPSQRSSTAMTDVALSLLLYQRVE